MKLIIFSAIFVGIISFEQVLGSMIHGVKGEEETIIADGSLVKPIEPSHAATENQPCGKCLFFDMFCGDCKRKNRIN